MFEFAVLLLALYLAWNIGGNDVANTMAPVYGSRTLSLKKILVFAAVMEFLGAVTLGQNITKTIGSGIIQIGIMPAIILAACLWTTFSCFKRLPISVTQATVGSIIGFGLVKSLVIGWKNLSFIALAWLLSPFLAVVLAFGLYYLVKKIIAHKYKTIESYERMQKRFSYLQIISAGLLAFTDGANNVGLAVGVVGPLGMDALLLRIVGGFALMLGILTIGKRVIKTVGDGITFISPVSGFVSQIVSTAIMLFFISVSIPVSVTHIILGSLIGVGLLGKVNWRTVGKVGLFALLTIPVSALLAIGLSFFL